MKKPLLALLAVAAVVVVAVLVVVENTPERRMDRRFDKLLRTYDDPKQLYQRVLDDRDQLGFFLVNAFLVYKGLGRCSCGVFSGLPQLHRDDCDSTTYLTQHQQLFNGFSTQFEVVLCDCGTAPSPLLLFPIIEEEDLVPIQEAVSIIEGDAVSVFYGHHVFSRHPADCSFARAFHYVRKTWTPYILRKTKEFREAWVNR